MRPKPSPLTFDEIERAGKSASRASSNPVAPRAVAAAEPLRIMLE